MRERETFGSRALVVYRLRCMTKPFRKSTKCANAACIEVAPDPARPLIRDSKDPAGPVLSVSPQAWRSFLMSLR